MGRVHFKEGVNVAGIFRDGVWHELGTSRGMNWTSTGMQGFRGQSIDLEGNI